MKQFAFLKSNRFWAIVVGAIALALAEEGVISEAVATALVTISAAFTTVRTVDRFSDPK